MTPSAAARWIVRPRARPDAALRLVCFPYAGSGAQVYRTWPDALPADVEVLSIALPGRDARLREPLFHRMPPLVAALTDAIGAAVRPPFAIFGHSFGALLGFAFALELRRRGLPEPVQLFASGRRAPQLPEPTPMHDLPEPEFLAGLRRLGGIPDTVFDEPELMGYFLPIL
ncbi:MAG TPA: alpha/beta fold hydrolase, partial [Kofleriaceae bacterium]|nr:alpha/beta fold hydrolase [Kofleriaceae bacterium]